MADQEFLLHQVQAVQLVLMELQAMQVLPVLLILLVRLVQQALKVQQETQALPEHLILQDQADLLDLLVQQVLQV